MKLIVAFGMPESQHLLNLRISGSNLARFFFLIHLFNVGKVRYTIPVNRKNSFPFKNKMLNKQNFRTKIMNKTKFFSTARNYY